MRDPGKLRTRAEATERRAAVLADAAAAELWRPTPGRAPLEPLLAELRGVMDEAAHLVFLMRQVVPPPTYRERRPLCGDVATPKYLADLRGRLAVWPAVMRAMQDCLAGHDWPLLPEPRPRLDLAEGQSRIVADLLTQATYALNPLDAQAEDATAYGCFADIPMHAAAFMANAHLVYRILLARKHRGSVRFLDVGCGGGLKVALAGQVFDRAEGLDFDPGYVAVANRAFGAMQMPRCTAFQADGMTFDGYGDYDVIFFFKPMYEPELLTMERHAIAAARVGTILIVPTDGFFLRAPDLGLCRIADAVYVKGVDDAQAAALVAETRRMGPHIVPPDRGLPAGAGWLAPLWRACEANGIRPDAA